ncbi:hypothetical protein KZC52_13305 [Microbacterium sp. kSW2-24]|uniref:hypothetical protein n=1 Tax=Microbacterium galbinum TaxID=2851646 RepID=UPI001FFCE606|nr:hypothetical protein [Microbacterium galbinum]MCK2023910.1 hypothetical protein [Microbacterium galbinum]
MTIQRMRSVALAALGLCALLLTGCIGMSAEEKVAVQEVQLQDFTDQANGWGGEILAQIPEAELEPGAEYVNYGGVRQVSDYNAEWPKYYYWATIVELRADGPRTPTNMANDLEPWLEEQGWKRNSASEFPPGEESFTRDYHREGYRLAIEVFTEPPPRVQSLRLSIVTPYTDPDR